MTDDRTLERAARSWLEQGPTQAPDRAVEAALSRIQTIRQERDLRVPWRNPRMNRYLLPIAAALIVAIGAVYLITRPTTSIGPSSTPTPGASTPPSSSTPSAQPASIEGTWDVAYSRQEMLDAGIADQAEDNDGNYGHFRLTFQGTGWELDQIAPFNRPGGTSRYSVGDGLAHLYSPFDFVTFDIPYTVTATTLTFGSGGPITFRVKPWSRVATKAIATPVPGPLEDGVYDGPILQASDIVAAVDADPTLSAAQKTHVIDVLFGITGHTTWQDSIELLDGQLFERQLLDGVAGMGSFGRYSFPDSHTLAYTETINGVDTTMSFELTVDGASFTLHRITPLTDPEDEFVTHRIFESGPFVLR
jgi:hypothetical protein